MGQDDVQITIVTPEHSPLSLFGEEAERAVAEELEAAGIALRTGVVARRAEGGLTLEPGGELLDAQRVFAVPRIVGPAIEGRARRRGGVRPRSRRRTGRRLRAHLGGRRRRRVADSSSAGLPRIRPAVPRRRSLASPASTIAPDPGEPVIRGRLLAGRRSRRLRGRGDRDAAPLWWPQGKVAGVYLPRWLAEHGVAPPASASPPDDGVEVHRPSPPCAAPRRSTCSTSAASSAAPIRTSPRSGAGCMTLVIVDVT